jgi:hypothetical protein
MEPEHEQLELSLLSLAAWRYLLVSTASNIMFSSLSLPLFLSLSALQSSAWNFYGYKVNIRDDDLHAQKGALHR